MELVPILLRQLMIMAIYMAVGYILFKKKFVSVQGCKELGSLLLYVILPCAIVNSYRVERTPERTGALVWSTAVSLGALALSMAVCAVLFRRRKVERFGVSFSNAGFIGIPLVTSVLGGEAVIYISSFVALLNIFQWTYGVVVMTDSLDSVRPRQLAKNPILIAVVIGLILFFFQPELPGVAAGALTSLASMNGPVAMLILGIYLAQVEWKSVFNAGILYFSALVRLLLIPVLTAACLLFLPLDPTLRLAVLIAASAPIGSNVAIFAQIHHQDYSLAVREVCLSTILCVVTMPVVIAGYSMLA